MVFTNETSKYEIEVDKPKKEPFDALRTHKFLKHEKLVKNILKENVFRKVHNTPVRFFLDFQVFCTFTFHRHMIDCFVRFIV